MLIRSRGGASEYENVESEEEKASEKEPQSPTKEPKASKIPRFVGKNAAKKAEKEPEKDKELDEFEAEEKKLMELDAKVN